MEAIILKNMKWLVIGVAVVTAVAATITTIVIFRGEILEFLLNAKDKFEEKKSAFFTKSELSDYADI